jgi:hypothetical protein
VAGRRRLACRPTHGAVAELGFCARHAWGFAAAEAERRGRLFLTAIVYEHFVEGAVEVTTARLRTWGSVRWSLTRSCNCLICDRLSAGASLTSEAPRDWKWLAEKLGQRLPEQVEAAWTEWIRWACPRCVPGGVGLVCRPHLLTSRERPDGLGTSLALLAARLETRRTRPERARPAGVHARPGRGRELRGGAAPRV